MEAQSSEEEGFVSETIPAVGEIGKKRRKRVDMEMRNTHQMEA